MNNDTPRRPWVEIVNGPHPVSCQCRDCIEAEAARLKAALAALRVTMKGAP